MQSKFLMGVTAAFIALAPVSASAGAADEIQLGRLSGQVELANTGVVAVNFVQGHELVARRGDRVVPASLARGAADAQRYYGASTILTVCMLIVAAFAFVGVTFASRAVGTGRVSEARKPEGWRDELMRMLEADLSNLDGLKHTISCH